LIVVQAADLASTGAPGLIRPTGTSMPDRADGTPRDPGDH